MRINEFKKNFDILQVKNLYGNGPTLFLIKDIYKESIISALNEGMKNTNIFKNISIKPYNGKKYNKNNVIWIVIG